MNQDIERAVKALATSVERSLSELGLKEYIDLLEPYQVGAVVKMIYCFYKIGSLPAAGDLAEGVRNLPLVEFDAFDTECKIFMMEQLLDSPDRIPQADIERIRGLVGG